MEPEPGLEVDPRRQVGIQGWGPATAGGGLSDASLSGGLVGLELDRNGGRLFPASRFASFGVRLITFGVFSEIRFTWQDVQRVERVQGWVPWDRDVRFKLRDWRQFAFSSLLGERLQTILNYAEARGAPVARTWSRSNGPARVSRRVKAVT